jgi:hypothetical protein
MRMKSYLLLRRHFKLPALFIIIFTIYIKSGLIVAAYADTGLLVSPPITYINARPPFQTLVPIQIENTSQNTISTSIQFLPFAPRKTLDGTVTYLPKGQMYLDADRSILSTLRILDAEKIVTEVTLGPKQKKQLHLQLTLPQQSKSEDYYFSVVLLGEITGDKEQKTSNSLIRTGVASHVVLSVNPENEEIIFLDDFRTGSFQQRSPVSFQILTRNASKHYINVSGSIVIKNMFDQPIAKIPIRKQAILAQSSRYLGKELIDATPDTLWHENLLFGRYTATLTLESEQSDSIQRTVSFWVFPFHSIALIFTGLIILFLIVKRVVQKAAVQ